MDNYRPVSTSNKFVFLEGATQSKKKSKRDRRRKSKSNVTQVSNPGTQTDEREESDEESEEVEEPQKKEQPKKPVSAAPTKSSPEVKKSVLKHPLVDEFLAQFSYKKEQVLAALARLEREGAQINQLTLLRAVQADETGALLGTSWTEEPSLTGKAQNGARHEEKSPNGVKREIPEDLEVGKGLFEDKQEEKEEKKEEKKDKEDEKEDWSNPRSLERAVLRWDFATKEGQAQLENWVTILTKAKQAKQQQPTAGESDEKQDKDDSWKAFDTFLSSQALENFVEKLLLKFPNLQRSSPSLTQNVGSLLRLCLTDYSQSDTAYQRWLLSHLSTLSNTLTSCSNKDVFLQKIRQVITTQKRSMSSNTHIIQLVKEEDVLSRSNRQKEPSPSERKAAEAKYAANSTIAGFFERAGADAGPLRRLWDQSLKAAIQLQTIESKVKRFRDALKAPQDDLNRAFSALEKSVQDDLEKKRSTAETEKKQREVWLSRKQDFEAKRKSEVGALTQDEKRCLENQRQLLQRKRELELELSKINIQLEHESDVLIRIQQEIQKKSANSNSSIHQIEEQIAQLTESTTIFEKDKICAEAICKLIVGISRQMNDIASTNVNKLSKVWGETSREYLRKATDQILASQQLVNFLAHRVSVLERKVKDTEEHTKKEELGLKKFEGLGMEDLGLKKFADSAAQLRKEMTDMIKQDNEVIDQIIKNVRQTLDTIANVLQESLTIPGLSTQTAQNALYQTAENFLKKLDDQRVSFVDLNPVRQFVPTQSPLSSPYGSRSLVSLPDHSPPPPHHSQSYIPSPQHQQQPQYPPPQQYPPQQYHIPQYSYSPLPPQYTTSVPMYVSHPQLPLDAQPYSPPPVQHPPPQHVSRSIPQPEPQPHSSPSLPKRENRQSFEAKKKKQATYLPVNRNRGAPQQPASPQTVPVERQHQESPSPQPQPQQPQAPTPTSFQPPPQPLQSIVIEPQIPAEQQTPDTTAATEVSATEGTLGGTDSTADEPSPSSTPATTSAASSVTSSPRPTSVPRTSSGGTPGGPDSKVSYASATKPQTKAPFQWGGATRKSVGTTSSWMPDQFPQLPSSSPQVPVASAPVSSTPVSVPVASPSPSPSQGAVNSPSRVQPPSRQQSSQGRGTQRGGPRGGSGRGRGRGGSTRRS